MSETSAYNPTQQKVLIILPMFFGLISAVASGAILNTIRNDKRKNGGSLRTYDKLMAGYSFTDIVVSVNAAFSSIPVPRETGIFLAYGNDATCKTQAFFTSWLLGIYLWNISICILFLFVVRFRKSDSWIRKNVEPFLIGFPIVFMITGSLIPFFFNAYGFDGFTRCFFASSPPQCFNDENVECTTGEYAVTLAWIILGAPLLLTFAVIIIVMLIIYWSIRKIEASVWKYRFRRASLQVMNNIRSLVDSGNNSNAMNMEEENKIDTEQEDKEKGIIPPERSSTLSLSDHEPNLEAPKVNDRPERIRSPSTKTNGDANRLSRAAAKQGLLYSSAFVLTQIFSFYRRVHEGYRGQPVAFTVFVFDRIFYPSQGFFNYFIFHSRRTND